MASGPLHLNFIHYFLAYHPMNKIPHHVCQTLNSTNPRASFPMGPIHRSACARIPFILCTPLLRSLIPCLKHHSKICTPSYLSLCFGTPLCPKTTSRLWISKTEVSRILSFGRTSNLHLYTGQMDQHGQISRGWNIYHIIRMCLSWTPKGMMMDLKIIPRSDTRIISTKPLPPFL